LVCSATAGTKTALGILQLWFNLLRANFVQGIWHTLFQGS